MQFLRHFSRKNCNRNPRDDDHKTWSGSQLETPLFTSL